MTQAICIEKLSNVRFDVEDEGDTLVARFDLTSNYGETKSGKSLGVSTTHGMKSVMVGEELYKANITITKPK